MGIFVVFNGQRTFENRYGPKANVPLLTLSLPCFLIFSLSKHIEFGILEPHEISNISEVEVVNRELYSVSDRLPVKHGVLDRRLVSLSLSPSSHDHYEYRAHRTRIPSAIPVGAS